MRTSLLRLAIILLATSCPRAAAAATDSARFEAADALRRSGKLAEAQAAYEALAKEDPANIRATIALATLAMQRDDPEKAIALLEAAAKHAPNDSELHRNLGDAYGRSAQKKGIFGGLGLGKKCLAAYERAVALDPKNLPARMSLFEYYRQAPGIAGGSEEKAALEAAEIEQQANALKQNDPARARLTLASLYVAQKKLPQAFALFEEALKNAPDDYTANYQLGRLAAMSGQEVDRGLAALRRCLELAPPNGQPGHAAAHWRIGNLLEKKGDLAGARAAYQASLATDANFKRAAEALKKLPATR